MTIDIFNDRTDAGARLAARLSHYSLKGDTIVLTIPREAVEVGREVARLLQCPFDVIITRKLCFPDQPDLAIGVVSETGTMVRNNLFNSSYRISKEYIAQEITRQKEEIEWRVTLYRGGRRLPSLQGKTVILVDDGVITGSILKSVIQTILREQAGRLVVAMTVASRDAARDIRMMADETVCLESPIELTSIGRFYRHSPLVTDEEIMETLMADHIEPQPICHDKAFEIPSRFISRA